MRTIDWMADFQARFGSDTDVNCLGSKKIHGYVQINFCDGRPVNYNLMIHKRVSQSFPEHAQTNPTFTRGD